MVNEVLPAVLVSRRAAARLGLVVAAVASLLACPPPERREDDRRAPVPATPGRHRCRHAAATCAPPVTPSPGYSSNTGWGAPDDPRRQRVVRSAERWPKRARLVPSGRWPIRGSTMSRNARLVIVPLCVVLLAGCAASPAATSAGGSSPVGAERSPVQRESSTASPCMSSTIEGQLILAAGLGVDLKEPNGSVRRVIWPDGYTFSPGKDRTVVDGQGTAIAKVGDQVELGGGESGPENAWLVCPGKVAVKSSNAP
jgi:hypothetical protein